MQNDAHVPRAEVLRAILKYRWVKSALSLWAIIAAYDTASSQIIPAAWVGRFPKVRELITMTSGWLPVWGWLLILAALLVVASFEYACRRSLNAATTPVSGISPPNMIALAGMIACGIGLLGFAGWYFWPALHAITEGPSATGRAQPPSGPSPQATVTPTPPADEPLPKNAIFKYGGKVYWAAPRRYTKEEAGEMRSAIREVYDCINTKSPPIVSNWDGSAVVFTRNWLQIVQGEGRESAIAKLDDIRSHLRASYNDLQEILNRRPYYRQDITSIINDHGEFGEMNGALNDYIEAVKTVPDKPGTDLVKRVIGPPEAALEHAITKYTNWMAAFNTKTLLLRDELEALMTG